ncbi:hypothetical protein EXIGLDRAFT_778413 [Exidia glandulosa HHB12029]|uniref:MYND-type domain-containing protein n=1 Tax=Exidia glandulosa HHB12029 TaxID=1314781 RepID=A0A165CJG4_EXIGL|nr:hypothetical protein EXIGLDRAFT_778413 [Exidia glandulosa HHB12029]
MAGRLPTRTMHSAIAIHGPPPRSSPSDFLAAPLPLDLYFGTMPGDISRLERDACTFAAQFRAFTATTPSLCHHCFYAFAGGLDSSAHGYLSTKCPQFLDAVMGFVVSDFCASDWERRKAMSTELLVFQTLSCPTCSPLGIRDLMHADFMIRSNEIPFDTLFDLCCRLLTRCLVPPSRRQRNTPTSPSKIPKKPFRSGSWPSTFEQLFPRGVEQTVSHFVQLTCVIQSGPIALLAAMLQRCRQPVFEEIMHPRHNCLLLRRVIAALGEAAELASAALSAHNQSTGSPNASRTPTSDRAVLKEIAKYDDFAVLLRAISSGVDYEVHDLDRFAFCYEARLYRSVVSVLEKLYNPFAWDYDLPNVAIFLYSSLDAADRLDPPMFIRRAVFEGSKRMEDPYIRVACNLPIVLQRRACFGPRCGKQVHENPSGKAFAKCARCRAIQYCSKECQRNDWTLKNGQPHKIICDILSEVLTIVSAEAVAKTAPDGIAQAWRNADLPVLRTGATP